MFPIAWRTFHPETALVAPIILWLEYFLCAHHTNFPNFQLLGTCADLHRPAFLPTWPFTACTPPCTPFRCRRENGSMHILPMETSFGHWNMSLLLQDENPIIGRIFAGKPNIWFF